jgi:hypothetical protein
LIISGTYWVPISPNWWLLRAVDLSGSTPSQRHFSRVSNNRQLALFRPLKAVARVRIPSGLQIKMPLTRPDTTTSQPAPPRIDRQGRARDARTPASAVFGPARDQPTSLAQHWLECRRSRAVARLDLVSVCNAHWHPATTPLDDRALSQARGAIRHVGDRQAHAIRLKDAGRRQKLAIAGGFPDQSPLSQNWRRE